MLLLKKNTNYLHETKFVLYLLLVKLNFKYYLL